MGCGRERNECPNQLWGLLKASYLLRASRLKMHTDVLNVFVCFGSVVPIIMQHLPGDKDSSVVRNRPRKKNPLSFSCTKHLSNCSTVITYLQRGKNGQIYTAWNNYPEIILWSRDHILHDREVPGNCYANSAKLYAHLGKTKKQKQTKKTRTKNQEKQTKRRKKLCQFFECWIKTSQPTVELNSIAGCPCTQFENILKCSEFLLNT